MEKENRLFDKALSLLPKVKETFADFIGEE